MKISYLLPIAQPAKPELDAAVQGAELLGRHHPGPVVHLYPARRYRRWLPRSLSGIRHQAELRRLDATVDLHVLFSDRLRSYPFLTNLKKPLVYALMTGLDDRPHGLPTPRLPSHWRLAVPSRSDRTLLEGRGFRRVSVIPPGLELERFSRAPAPEGPGLTLLAGSAPWTERQFETKGVDLLLETARRRPELRLVFLWRGMLVQQMTQRVERLGLGARVEVIHERVDVDRILARVHAAIVLSRSAKLVKAYPHSLLEALAAGRPVIVSRSLAMSRFVERHGCGEVVDRLAADDLLAAVDHLETRYEERRQAALRAPLEPFSVDAYLEAFEALFRELGGRG